MAVFSIILGVLIAILSLLFWTDRVPKQIIDFDKIQREEKNTLRRKALARNIGGLLLLLAVLFILTGVFPVFREKYLLPFFIGWSVLVVADVYFIQKSGRYRKK